ncbi:unnamed protein product [Rotaria sordida]|uniref:Uncharacterized protein n=1 Tax=Rotaria sordida TaxID=392033 RepID=A0A815ULQ9_9BILA|nr:unnamed protein product [Rotaria sordida]
MSFIDQLNLLFLFINIITRCLASTSPRGTRKEVNQVFTTGIHLLNLDSDDENENDKNQHGSARPHPSTQVHGTFNDDKDEGHDTSSTDTSSRLSAKSSVYRRPNQFTLSESDSNDESNFRHEQMSEKSGSTGDRQSRKKFFVPETPGYGSVSFDDFLSPPSRIGPLGSGPVASLNELYHSPIGAFNQDRRYLKAAKSPLTPGSNSVGVISVKGREIPREFLQVVDFGDSCNNEIPQCVHENDIESLYKSDDPCNHKLENGLIRKSSCSADPDLVLFEYYIAEKVALTRGLVYDKS